MRTANPLEHRLRVTAALLIGPAVTVGIIRPDCIANAATAATARAELVQLPMRFEPNQGQTDPRVQFVSRGSGYALFLTKDEAVLALRADSPSVQSPRMRHVAYAKPSDKASAGAVFRIKLRDANPNPRIAGLEPMASRSNYFTGSDPKQWRTGVANYAEVAYRDVYPGIDLVYHGNGQQLEYDFVVAPGTDPQRIRLSIAGADQLLIGHDGQLHIRAGASEIVEHAPVAYQQIGDTRHPVESSFVRGPDNTIGFQVASYDQHLPLTIDPTLVYSTYLGSGNVIAYAIAVDSSNHAYVTGLTSATDFPTTTGALQTTGSKGPEDGFVSELNASGTALVYSTYLGGSGFSSTVAYGIAVDSTHDAYVAGLTEATDFPTTPGALQTVFGGGTQNAFIAKLNSTGSALIYSTYLGGSRNAEARALVLDSANNAYITGDAGSDLPVTAGAFQTTCTVFGRADGGVFVSKLNDTGSALVYSTHLCGAVNEDSNGIALDSAANAYVTGLAGSGFPTTGGALKTTFTNHYAWIGFVSKLNSTGTALVYSTYLGGSTGNDAGLAIKVDAANHAYVTGYASSTDFPVTPGAYQTTLRGSQNAFVSKLNTTGSALVYSTYLGGSTLDSSAGIALDSSNNAYVAGATESSDFPVTSGALQATYGGGTADAFVTKLNSYGKALLYSSFLGGSGEDSAWALTLDSSHNIHLTGNTTSLDFPITAGAFQTTGNIYQDAFISKVRTSP